MGGDGNAVAEIHGLAPRRSLTASSRRRRSSSGSSAFSVSSSQSMSHTSHSTLLGRDNERVPALPREVGHKGLAT